MDVSSLPFNRHLGLSLDPSGDPAAVVLQPSAIHLNHVATVHATVLYGVAEAASGQCLLMRFPSLADSSLAVLRSSSVKYRRPAAPDCRIDARGTLPDEAAARFFTALTSRGRASVEIDVSVTQDDMELFRGTFVWFVTGKES